MTRYTLKDLPRSRCIIIMLLLGAAGFIGNIILRNLFISDTLTILRCLATLYELKGY